MNTFWNDFLSHIKEKTSSQIFETWFKPLKLESFSADCIDIGVPNQFFADRLNKNYKDLIEKTIFFLTKNNPDLKFSVVLDKIEKISFADYDEKKEEKKYFIPKNINSNYTFSNFVVGSSNQFAHAACQAVSNHPGGTYNPLFIYGGVGLGKTHLLHAILHNCLKKNNILKVYYLSAEKFTNDLINSIRYEKMLDFRNRYRKIDVLLLDDIQFIAGKERTQEEFFHTFNSLFEIKKQIVVTSDKTPREIKSLEERIRNRFEWGLIADIQMPDTETKVAILKKKALSNSIHLPNDVAFLLADNVNSNVRELEGLLTRLHAFSSLYSCDISVDFTKEVLKDLIKIDVIEKTPEDILKIVSKFFNVKVFDLKSRKKNNSIVLPRQVAMYVMRKKTALSLPEIGHFFSGKDHSTVIYSIKKIKALIIKDKKIKECVDSILKKLL